MFKRTFLALIVVLVAFASLSALPVMAQQDNGKRPPDPRRL